MTARTACLLFVMAVAGACDARLGPDDGPTRIRFVNAAPDALGPLRFALEGGPTARLERGEHSAYLAVDPRTWSVAIHDEAGAWTVTGNLQVAGGLYQTLVAFGEALGPAAILLGDEPGRGRENQAVTRFLHLAPGLSGTLDVHFLPEGDAVDPDRAAIAGLDYPATQEHFPLNAGTWRVVLARGGEPDIVLDSGPLVFTGRHAYTFIIFNADDGSPHMLRIRDGA